ncbi:unnamed protein product [Urochloa decumbens]|uniref:F-box domain-containing protein n=1 Tax=Urochloa decumbens TaxID=240449 RepID=A0ABC8WDX4_9POAL
MGRKKNQRRRRSRPATPKRRQTSTCRSRTNIHDLPDDLLELVLRRIRSPFYFVRAAAACKLWRRLLAAAADDNDFLSRLHQPPPHVLGHYYDEGSTTVFVPATTSPKPPGNRKAPVNVSLDVDFLSGHYSGRLALSDGHGRLLAFVHSNNSYSSVVLCNPWTREHRELRPPRYGYWCCTIGAFLLAGAADMSCFKVLCVWLDRNYSNGNKTAHAAVFSAREDGWLLLGSAGVGDIMPSLSCWLDTRTKFLGRAGGSLCWSGEVSDTVLHLDEGSGVFSTITLPAPAAIGNSRSMSYHRGNLRVVRGTSASVRFARVVGDEVEVLCWWHDYGGEFVVDRKVCLSQLAGIERLDDWSWRFLDTAETPVTPGDVVLSPDEEYRWMFSLDVGTMEMKPLRKSNSHAHRVFPCELPWPPTIKVCV